MHNKLYIEALNKLDRLRNGYCIDNQQLFIVCYVYISQRDDKIHSSA